MREIEAIENNKPVEEITEFAWYSVGVVRVAVSKGYKNAKGEFYPYPGQQPEVYQILQGDFQSLMSKKGKKPKDVFRKDDLWEYIDKIRKGQGAEAINQITQHG